MFLQPGGYSGRPRSCDTRSLIDTDLDRTRYGLLWRAVDSPLDGCAWWHADYGGHTVSIDHCPDQWGQRTGRVTSHPQGADVLASYDAPYQSGYVDNPAALALELLTGYGLQLRQISTWQIQQVIGEAPTTRVARQRLDGCQIHEQDLLTGEPWHLEQVERALAGVGLALERATWTIYPGG